MEQAKTHLGNDRLHKTHSVMVEGGAYPRAKVMDQMMIDRYLMHDLIDLPMHQAGEYLLGQAQRAGLWATGVNLSATRVDGGTQQNIPFGVIPYHGTIKAVKKKYGWFHGYVTERVVCFNWDIAGDEFRLDCLKQALNCIAEKRMGGGRDPLHRLRKAAEGGKP